MPYTFSELVTDIVANMEEDSTEFTSALPSIISRAQSYLQRHIDPIAITRYTDVTVQSSARTMALPTDLLILRSIEVSTTAGAVNLKQQTNEYLTAYWPTYTSVGTPKYYANKDNATVFLAPTPNATVNATVKYVPRVTVLASAFPSNWFSEYADAALFASAMMYANAWTKNPNAVTVWKNLADEELATINNEARRSRRSDTSDRSMGTPENNIADGQR